NEIDMRLTHRSRMYPHVTANYNGSQNPLQMLLESAQRLKTAYFMTTQTFLTGILSNVSINGSTGQPFPGESREGLHLRRHPMSIKSTRKDLGSVYFMND
ncbi:hypothetical protein CHS0354_040259, partial [Potamilus streckersoni]